MNGSIPQQETATKAPLRLAVVAGALLGVVATAAFFLVAKPLGTPQASSDSAAAAATVPDWTGKWEMPRIATRLMFDPDNAYLEPDPGRGLDFGPVGGSYLTTIPYTPEFQKEYMDRIAMHKAGKPTDPVGADCRPYGMPRVMAATPNGPLFMKEPELILIVLGDEIRRIYMDGRPHPTAVEDVVLSFEGHSIGHWEGETLVIDTVNVFEGNYDQSDAKHSDQIHVVERIRQIDADTLENQITVMDALMFTKPYTVTRNYKRNKQRYPEVVASNCTPNDQVDIVDGVQVQRLPFE
jgi:hypothetical protein